jgi:prophage maintenance system killer protein
MVNKIIKTVASKRRPIITTAFLFVVFTNISLESNHDELEDRILSLQQIDSTETKTFKYVEGFSEVQRGTGEIEFSKTN